MTWWLPVMTLPDGTTIEIPMPSPEDTDEHGVHGYRVRRADGVTVFSTLTEVATHVLDERLTGCLHEKKRV